MPTRVSRSCRKWRFGRHLPKSYGCWAWASMTRIRSLQREKIEMQDLNTLKVRARAGDLRALQELRDRGFFSGAASDGQRSAADRRRAPLSYHQERLWFIDRFET